MSQSIMTVSRPSASQMYSSQLPSVRLVAQRVRAYLQHRRSVAVLRAMDDRLLQDIGLLRCEIR